MNSSKKVVTRFAPSPTGFMHVGGVRTALFAWLWAKKNNGTFILRIEDTDKAREVDGSIEHIIESLKWLGITWSEGPDIGGQHAPYIQSQRLESYKKYANILIEKGLAYPDPYTEEEVEAFRKQAEENKEPFLYRNYRPEKFEVWDGKKPLRFKVPTIERKKWHDIVRGDLEAGEEALDDFILIKSDGYPTYNFAHIIDDLEMEVTHIMRADEFISSTPKFLSLYEALEITPPEFVTLPPIMGPDGKKKLGKRDGAKDILEYRGDGILPIAMVNFLALLGWNPGTDQEIFNLENLTSEFDITRIQKSGAKLNEEKLLWINKEHIKSLPGSLFWEYAYPYMDQEYLSSKEKLAKLEAVIRDHISCFSDIKKLVENGDLEYYFRVPQVQEGILAWKNSDLPTAKENLKKLVPLLESVDEANWTKETIKEKVWPLTDAVGRGDVLWPMRVSLTGKEKSPDPFVVAEIIGRNETLERVQNILK